jgi:N-acetylmuramoyl-L-alanine amidase
MSRVTKNGEPHIAEAKIPDRNAGGAAGRALSQITIAIDAAHGGSDEGSSAPGSPPEKELTLDIALALARSLQKGGTHVVLTRETDEDVPLYERPLRANSAGADLFLSIHLNSCESPAAQGTAAYYFCRQGYYSETGQLLADHIVASVADELMIPKIPVLGRNYAVLRETEMPAVLIEPYFITCPWGPEAGNSPLADSVAESIYRGLEAYFRF